jgi:hypothetical protein
VHASRYKWEMPEEEALLKWNMAARLAIIQRLN